MRNSMNMDWLWIWVIALIFVPQLGLNLWAILGCYPSHAKDPSIIALPPQFTSSSLVYDTTNHIHQELPQLAPIIEFLAGRILIAI